jgi:hypothetical protein
MFSCDPANEAKLEGNNEKANEAIQSWLNPAGEKGHASSRSVFLKALNLDIQNLIKEESYVYEYYTKGEINSSRFIVVIKNEQGAKVHSLIDYGTEEHNLPVYLCDSLGYFYDSIQFTKDDCSTSFFCKTKFIRNRLIESKSTACLNEKATKALYGLLTFIKVNEK